ncbi:MAG TPA: glucose-1-phosphate thymidylyltransferase [Thermoplasmata archaeon]|nr:glucose-1-phosphate thymidylyltransferase [Thermoplasmata archaeon]
MPLKGLLLAGGHGTRLRPLTFTGNKHMIPIANQPMLYYGLRHLKEAGVQEVGIILGPITEGIREAVGDGSAFGVHVEYIVQGEPRGLAHAVLVARSFLGEDPFLMYLGDNLLESGPRAYLDAFANGTPAAVVGAVAVDEPSHYGVVELDGADRIVSIEEKPKKPRSNLALVGVYLFTPEVHEVIRDLRPSPRGELEITDAIRALSERTGRVRVVRLPGWWKDTGQVSDILVANERVLATRPGGFFENRAQVAAGATVTGPVGAGVGTILERGVTVIGPTILGAGVRIADGARVGPYVSAGDGCVIRQASVERSILLDNVELDVPGPVSRSIVGRGSKILRSAAGASARSFVLGDSSQILL